MAKRHCSFLDIIIAFSMARSKKLFYGEHEKKCLSQARNLGTDRVIKKVREHGLITGHKVFIINLVFF